jgi:sugar/nucleoside kinase (ribokinase family)
LHAAGLVGDDEPGEWIRETCAQQGVDTSLLIRVKDSPTSYTDVMTIAGTGRRTFFHQRGANALLDNSMIELRRVNSKIFHLGYLLLLDRLDQPDHKFGTRAGRLLAEASELGLITSIDVVSEESNRFARVVKPVLPQVDVLFLNEFEATRVSSYEIRVDGQIDAAQLARSADALIRAGVRRWAVIHFPEGVLAAAADGTRIYQPSLRVEASQVAGAAGAGDALAAGVLLGFHDQLPMQQCLEFGVCAAGACLSHPSCTAGMMTLEKCLALASRFGFRDKLPGFR